MDYDGILKVDNFEGVTLVAHPTGKEKNWSVRQLSHSQSTPGNNFFQDFQDIW